MPDLNDFDGKIRSLLVLDNLMTSTDDRLVDLFTKISRHRNLCSLPYTKYILQKQAIENAKFKLTSPGLVPKRSQVANLALKMYPGKSAFIVEAFKNATSAPYGYLLIDLKQETTEKLRLRTELFPGDDLFVYVRK